MRKKKVLIVDDSNLIVSRLCEMVEEYNEIEEVHCAYTVSDAVTILNRETPDFVSLDISLPDASGIDLLKIIKRDHPQTVVAMLTSQASPFYRTLCFNLGADHFLDKSADFEHIFDFAVNTPNAPSK